jgi:hypothetical protein
MFSNIDIFQLFAKYTETGCVRGLPRQGRPRVNKEITI